MKFFRKLIPKTKVVLSSGVSVQFKTLDGLTGYRATNDATEIKDYYDYMAAQRYGMTEISEEDYNLEYVEKKRQVGSTQLPTWNREHLGQTGSRPINPLHILGSDAVRAVVGISGSDIRMEDSIPEPAIGNTKVKPQIEPEVPLNLGKRK